MITETDVEQRAVGAAAEIQRAVHGLPVADWPVPQHHTSRRLVVALVAVAVLVAAVAIPTLIDRKDRSVATDGAAVPYFMPTFVPAAVTLHRAAETRTDPSSVVMFAGSSQPGVEAVLVQVSRVDSGGTIPGATCTVRGLTCIYSEATVDNGVTWRSLLWFEGNSAIGMQSTFGDREALFAAAEEATFTDGTVANRDLAGLPRVHESTDAAEIRMLVDPTRLALTLTITRTSGKVAPAFMPGRPVDVNGAPGWLSHQPRGRSLQELTAIVSWAPRIGVTVTVTSTTLSDDELLRVARSVAPVSSDAWNALPPI